MTPALLVIAFIAGFIGLMIAAYRNTDWNEPLEWEDKQW